MPFSCSPSFTPFSRVSSLCSSWWAPSSLFSLFLANVHGHHLFFLPFPPLFSFSFLIFLYFFSPSLYGKCHLCTPSPPHSSQGALSSCPPSPVFQSASNSQGTMSVRVRCPSFVAAAEATLPENLDAKAGGSCDPGSHETATIRETALRRPPPPGHCTDRRLKHISSVSEKEAYVVIQQLCLEADFWVVPQEPKEVLTGNGSGDPNLVQSPSVLLQLTGTLRKGASTLAWCPAVGTAVEPPIHIIWLWWPAGLSSWIPQDYDQQRVLKLPSPGHGKNQRSGSSVFLEKALLDYHHSNTQRSRIVIQHISIGLNVNLSWNLRRQTLPLCSLSEHSRVRTFLRGSSYTCLTPQFPLLTPWFLWLLSRGHLWIAWLWQTAGLVFLGPAGQMIRNTVLGRL